MVNVPLCNNLYLFLSILCHPYILTIFVENIWAAKGAPILFSLLGIRMASCSYIYIYKEGLSRTVVREVLPRATAHGHQTFPDYGRHTWSRSKGGDVREEAPAEEREAKNLQMNVRHIGFTEKIYGFLRTFLCC